MITKNYSIGFERVGIDTGKVRNKKSACPKCDEQKKRHGDKPLFVSLETGHYKCHRCDFSGRVDSNDWIRGKKDKPEEEIQVTDHERIAIAKHSKNQFKPFILSPLNDQGLRYLKSRGISEKTATGAKIGQKGNTLVFNYYLNGKIVNSKYRTAGIEKKMWQHANAPKRVLYGIDNVKSSDKVIICEGELDALSFHEIGELCAVSVSQGAPNAGSNIGTKLQCLENCAKLLQGKKEIIIAVDNDANGLYLEEVLFNRFGKDRCKVVKYPKGCKDANDVLVKLGAEKLKECLKAAQYVPIDGVTDLGSVKDRMRQIKKNGVQKGFNIGIQPLADHFSFYKGWWNLYTGIPNSGKSEYVLFLMLCMSAKYGWKWAVFSPEHWPAEDFYTDVIEKFTGNGLDYIEDKDFELSMKFVEEHFYFVYFDAEDGKKNAVNNRSNIVNSIKQLTLSVGIDGFLIDPYNQLVKDSSDPKGERTDQELERSLGLIDRLCKTHNLCGNIVAHPRTIYKEQGELDYKCPTAYQVSGGAMWYNKAYTITAVHRPFNQSDKSNTSVLIDIQKIKSHKRAGTPAPVNMQFSHGWYIGEFEQRGQSALFGAFEKYKASLNEGTQTKAFEVPETKQEEPDFDYHSQAPF
jgi:twinkle protein